jgi:ligand-binding sensor domain-containing protein
MRCWFPVMAVGLCVAPSATAQSFSRDWRPEDRTVVGDFSRVNAIATSPDRVFIVSPAGLLIWNPQFRRWEGSFDPPDAGLLARVFTGLADPLDNSLWLARPDGWVHYQPDIQLWDQGVVPEGILGIAFDQGDPAAGLYIRTRRDWELLPRGGAMPTPARPPSRPLASSSVAEAIRSNPTLQANAAAILTDNRLRNVRYTAAARSFDNRGWYLGTSGLGALYLADGSPLPERLTYGLPSDRVGAVFSWPGGVWAATNRTPLTDAALTFVGRDLAEFHSLGGTSAVGTPFNQVRELAGQGKSVWAATDLGVARVEPADSSVELVDERRGLPDSRVYSIVSRGGRIVVGTAHGLARLGDSLNVERVAPGYTDAVYSVFPSGDSVWAGTPAGLLLAVPEQPGLVRPAGMTSPSLQTRVVDLTSLADTLVALTRDELLWRNPRTRRWTLGPNLSALLGRLRRFVADGPGFWVAGDKGVGFARLGTPPLRPLREGDLPGAINDLAVDDQYLWVATDRGLVRFRLDAIRP